MSDTPPPDSGPSRPAPLSLEVVRHVARLSRLGISEDAARLYAEQLGTVLEFESKLSRLDLEGVAPLVYPGETANVWRDDEPEEGLLLAQVLKLAPQSDGAFLQVPKVLDGAGGA